MRSGLLALAPLVLGLIALHACSDPTEPEPEPARAWGSVRAANVRATEHAGELLLSWIPPLAEEGLPALAQYEIVHSLESISEAAFDSLPTLELIHGGSSQRHELRVQDLELAVPHQFRIRAVDARGRPGLVSEELSGTPAAFDALVYRPEEDHLVALYGELLHFEVRDRDGEPFEVRFSVPSDTTTIASSLDWWVRSVDPFLVIATSYAGGDSLTHTWTVHSSAEELSPWAPVSSPELRSTEHAGELRISWSPPPENPDLPPLRGYSIAHSTQAITEEDFETLPRRELDHVAGLPRYETLFEDLALDTVHYFRIAAVDRANRVGQLSEELSAIPAALNTLSYEPPGEIVHARYGDLLRFEVSTIDGEPYEVQFEVPPDTLVLASTLDYRVRRLGLIPVFATDHSGADAHTQRWTVNATADLVGQVQELALGGSGGPGEVQLTWSPPPEEPGLPPLSYYEVVDSWKSIPDADFEILPKEVVGHEPGIDRYATTIEGLQLGVLHYFRIRAVDQLGRAGRLSEEISGTPPALFTLSGSIAALDAEYRTLTPAPGVLVVVSEGEASSDANGLFKIAATWGTNSIPLQLTPPSWSPPLHSMSLVLTDDQAHDPYFVLIPQTYVTVEIPQPTEWTFLRLLRHLSARLLESDEVAHWESYPVPVEVREQVLSNGVDYGAAMRLGIQKWNEAAGFPVLVEATGEPAIGVRTSYDLPQINGGNLLGSVTLVQPADGELYDSVPRKLSYRLSESYETQGVVDRVALHELGHVLYLTHSPSFVHVMSTGVSSVSPNEIHPQEAAALRALIHTPNGTRYSWYQE